MVCFSLSMLWLGGWRYLIGLSRQESSLVLLAAPPSFVVVITCHDDHQKVKGFLPRHNSWGFIPYLMQSAWALMRSGGAVHIMATWHVMAGGVNAPLVWLFGFSTSFLAFLCLVFKLPFSSLSSSLFPFPRHCCFVLFLLRVVLSCNFLRSSFLWVPFSKVWFLLV